MTLSNNLERKDKFDTGLKFFISMSGIKGSKSDSGAAKAMIYGCTTLTFNRH